MGSIDNFSISSDDLTVSLNILRKKLNPTPKNKPIIMPMGILIFKLGLN
jgi:hypothetical protein